MDYSNFEIEDFVTDDSFISWVLKGDPETNIFWNDLMRLNPGMRVKIERARILVVNLKNAEQINSEADFGQVDKLWNRIDAQIEPRVNSKIFFSMKIAASLLIFFLVSTGIGYWVLRPDTGIPAGLSEAAQTDFIEEVNTSGAVLKIHLIDGSIVSLAKDSRLRYAKDFRGEPNREVYLKGEAFFEVAKNPQQPFLVHANEVTTKVLGTSFTVTAYDDQKDIVVAVNEGKVSVFSSQQRKSKETQKEVNGVILTPNQKVVYTRADDSFSKTLIDKPEKVKEEPGALRFRFEDAPVKEVFESLSQAYGVEIIFDEEVMSNCFLTVPLGDEPLYEKMKIICSTVDASYELIDASLVVTSKGCK